VISKSAGLLGGGTADEGRMVFEQLLLLPGHFGREFLIADELEEA
jgi:hypothetical protein